MITISLCMIVKNEEAVLGRVLEQMRGIADEIIVVDTGSADRTREIAAQFTDHVFDYKWHQDFAAARNFACSKASMDYWMWLDADDVIRPDQQKLLLRLKESLNPATDIVMMKYLTGFDQNGHVTFSYYRERLIKNRQGFLWEGRVHEAVTPRGNILYSPVEIEHRKLAAGDSDRNLRIYETMIGEGETLCPRHQFYYGRELYYHQRYEEAVKVFEHFLEEPDGWVENRIDACLQLSRCREQLGQKREAFLALTGSFLYDEPRAEILCEIGRLLMGEHAYKTAAYWYQRALELTPRDTSGAFVLQDCYGYIPYMQLCVCFDHLGDHKKALEYHLLAKELRPEAEAVKQNQLYFDKLFQDEEG